MPGHGQGRQGSPSRGAGGPRAASQGAIREAGRHPPGRCLAPHLATLAVGAQQAARGGAGARGRARSKQRVAAGLRHVCAVHWVLCAGDLHRGGQRRRQVTAWRGAFTGRKRENRERDATLLAPLGPQAEAGPQNAVRARPALPAQVPRGLPPRSAHLAAALAPLAGLRQVAALAIKGRVGRVHAALLLAGLAPRVGALPLLAPVLGIKGVAAHQGGGHRHARHRDASNGAAAQAAAARVWGGRRRGDGRLVGGGAAGRWWSGAARR